MFNSKIESCSLTASGSEVCARNRSLSRSKQSAKLCAGSILMINVRCPNSASFIPVAAAKLVFPTPPLPVNIRIRIPPLYGGMLSQRLQRCLSRRRANLRHSEASHPLRRRELSSTLLTWYYWSFNPGGWLKCWHKTNFYPELWELQAH